VKLHFLIRFILPFAGLACSTQKQEVATSPPSYSGVYPHLAMYNSEPESGIGAVVPWADRLWAITYGPHVPFGSDDKLYEITPDLQQIVRDESIGGTPANRMIHAESNQLFIGPYAIDADRNVRVIPYDKIPGRPTGTARHLIDPAGKIYHGTMEEGFYEIDVKSLEPTLLYEDLNVTNRRPKGTPSDQPLAHLDGAHGKGLYSGQGVLVYSNNGETGPQALKQFDIESGSLSEWDGKSWKTVRRNQFVEVTGPGGIHGNRNPETDPIWATGWDHKSVLLGVRDHGKWSFYRLPKASHSYDGAHGWNTEWPRIRDVGDEGKADYLMTMHGLFWRFPGTFTSHNSAGIRPRSAYLKVIGDYTRWKNQLVFGCDDSAQKEFLNTRKLKGGIEGPGQSNSNLWFTSLDRPDLLGPNTAEGAVWISESVTPAQSSEPFLFTGWDQRSAWLANEGSNEIEFVFEADREGNNQWTEVYRAKLKGKSEENIVFNSSQEGEWVRVKVSAPTKATLHFSYTDTSRFKAKQENLFAGLAASNATNYQGGLLYGLGDNRRALGLLAGTMDKGRFKETGYYELDAQMNLTKKEDAETATIIREKFAIPSDIVTVENSSVLVVDDEGRRWRFPLGNAALTDLTNQAGTRICREVATERDLLNLHGSFYELPAENADGFAKVRPVSTHNLPIHDYASYRGLLILTGLDGETTKSDRIIRSEDGLASVWAGTIDDLWEFGKPVGEGGPWKDSKVKAGIPSDPYLIGFYDKKSLKLSHSSGQPVAFKIQVEPIGHGPWMTYKEVTVKSGETFEFNFPAGFQARWIRFIADKNCDATAWLSYQ
jgi:hypothetical protein